MEDTKIAEIRAFCAEKNLTDIIIEPKRQSAGRGRFKIHHYVSFTCTCGKKGRKQYPQLVKSPQCKQCMFAANRNERKDGKDAVVREFCKRHGLTDIEIHERKTPTDYDPCYAVSFTCKCGEKDKKKLSTLQKSPMCNACTNPPTISEQSIIAFCEANDLCELTIEKKEQSGGVGRTKTVYYVSFLCTCERRGRRKFQKLQENPVCKQCILDENPRVATEVNPRVTDGMIKEWVESLGHEFVSSVRDRTDGKTRIMVKFICKCVRETTREQYTAYWDAISEGYTCLKCTYGIRAETQKKLYEERGDEIREKIKATMIERYGVEHPAYSDEIRDRIKNTMVERYGVEHAFQVPEFKAKAEATNIERYGVRHPMQNAEEREKHAKSMYKEKEYKFPSGRTVKCQGYEPFAYDMLVKQFPEEDILVERDISAHNEIPIFWYEYEGKQHRYYPDICIWSQKKIIEVKSPYTAQVKPEILQLKRESVLKNKFLYEMWIFDSKGNLTIN